jgi:hypothetical protein
MGQALCPPAGCIFDVRHRKPWNYYTTVTIRTKKGVHVLRYSLMIILLLLLESKMNNRNSSASVHETYITIPKHAAIFDPHRTNISSRLSNTTKRYRSQKR